MVKYGIFLDSETNSLYPWKGGRLLEIAFQVYNLITNKLIVEYSTVVKQPFDVWKCSQTGALECNGMTWEKVQKGKDEIVVSLEIKEIFAKYNLVRGKAIFICQNPNFDRAFFDQLIPRQDQTQNKIPYHWFDLSSMHFTRMMLQIRLKKKPPKVLYDAQFSKDIIGKYYGTKPEEKPHGALNGVKHLKKVYDMVLTPRFKKKKKS
jgi:oligoribonuclease